MDNWQSGVSPVEGCRYCVLYTQVPKQWEVCEVIRKSLPEGRGVIFYPCVELWWNDEAGTVIRPLFPGYVFIRSDMEREELHALIMKRKKDILSSVRELKLAELRSSGGEPADMSGAMLSDLSGDEAEFLDFMLNFVSGGEESLAGKEKGTRAPKAGVIRMSYGYWENGKCVVMEGPLKGYEDRIVRVDRRKRKAYLDLEVNGHKAKAGLEIRGKGYWFPGSGEGRAVLGDGTEADLEGLAKRMMSGEPWKG